MNTIALPQSLLKRLDKYSESSKRSVSAFVKQVVQERLDYEDWKAQKIAAGLDDIAAGRLISHQELTQKMHEKIKATAENVSKKAN
ncbi:MAG: ribbon-helix-helix protein, CopG family [Gallionella sp.]